MRFHYFNSEGALGSDVFGPSCLVDEPTEGCTKNGRVLFMTGSGGKAFEVGDWAIITWRQKDRVSLDLEPSLKALLKQFSGLFPLHADS